MKGGVFIKDSDILNCLRILCPLTDDEAAAVMPLVEVSKGDISARLNEKGLLDENALRAAMLCAADCYEKLCLARCAEGETVKIGDVSVKLSPKAAKKTKQGLMAACADILKDGEFLFGEAFIYGV